MDPLLGGGEMIHEVFHDHSTYKSAPFKFEAGTMNIAEEIGLAAAIEYLEALGMDERSRPRGGDHARTRSTAARRRARRCSDRRTPSIRGGAVSFWYKDVHPHDLATILNEEGVAIRAGHHCAQLVMRRFDTPATARASFYVYNTKEDVDALVAALEKAGEFFGA